MGTALGGSNPDFIFVANRLRPRLVSVFLFTLAARDRRHAYFDDSIGGTLGRLAGELGAGVGRLRARRRNRNPFRIGDGVVSVAGTGAFAFDRATSAHS